MRSHQTVGELVDSLKQAGRDSFGQGHLGASERNSGYFRGFRALGFRGLGFRVFGTEFPKIRGTLS